MERLELLKLIRKYSDELQKLQRERNELKIQNTALKDRLAELKGE